MSTRVFELTYLEALSIERPLLACVSAHWSYIKTSPRKFLFLSLVEKRLKEIKKEITNIWKNKGDSFQILLYLIELKEFKPVLMDYVDRVTVRSRINAGYVKYLSIRKMLNNKWLEVNLMNEKLRSFMFLAQEMHISDVLLGLKRCRTAEINLRKRKGSFKGKYIPPFIWEAIYYRLDPPPDSYRCQSPIWDWRKWGTRSQLSKEVPTLVPKFMNSSYSKEFDSLEQLHKFAKIET